MLIKHGEDHHALPYEVLNPVPLSLTDVFFQSTRWIGWLDHQTHDWAASVFV